MDIFEAIKTRRSIRKFKDLQVPWEHIAACVEAGKSAPSSGNLQNWKFIVVQDESIRKSLATACLQQYWMESAPVHIVVVAEPDKAIRFYGIRGDRLYSAQNCAAAVQNILLAAHAQGLGACWVGAFDENEVKRACDISEEARPQAIIPLGYADETPPQPVHYTLENVLFMNKWGSRIADFDVVMGHWGNKLHKHVDAASAKTKKHTSSWFATLKNKLKKKEK